jgi:hypothetical protein
MLFFVTFSCKRNTNNDPTMHTAVGRDLWVTGRSNPNTLFVLSPTPQLTSNFTLRVINNKGQGVANTSVLFELYGENATSPGSFWGGEVKATKTTNNSGEASIIFYIPAGTIVQGDQMLYVKATVINSDRLDYYEAYDYIPLKIVSDTGPVEASPVRLYGWIQDFNNVGILQVLVNVSNTMNPGVTHSREYGFWSFEVPYGWFGDITATKEGYTFYPEGGYSISEESPLYENTQFDFRAVNDGAVLSATPSTYNFIQAGGDYSVTITNNGNANTLNYVAVSSDATWLTITAGTPGTTPGTLTISAATNITGGVDVTRQAIITVSCTNDTTVMPLTITITQSGD